MRVSLDSLSPEGRAHVVFADPVPEFQLLCCYYGFFIHQCFYQPGRYIRIYLMDLLDYTGIELIGFKRNYYPVPLPGYICQLYRNGIGICPWQGHGQYDISISNIGSGHFYKVNSFNRQRVLILLKKAIFKPLIN
jgi:hypothetical protein